MFTFDGQTGDKSYRTVEYLEKKSIRKRDGRKDGRRRRGDIDFQVHDALNFDQSGHEQLKLNFSMSFNLYTQCASTPNVLLENKINLFGERKRLIEQVC